MRSGVMYTALAVFVQVGVLLLTLSRSAVAGLGVAAVTFWGFGRSRVEIEIERTRLPAALGIAGAALLMVVLFVDVDSWAKRIEQSFGPDAGAFSRATIWRESLPVMRDFWLTGSGAGTYADAMTLYQQSRVWVGSMQRWAHFNNAHSHYVQVASEGGLLIGLPALLVIVLTAKLGLRAVRADKGEMFWVRVGALAGSRGVGDTKHLGGRADHARECGARRRGGRAAALSPRPVQAGTAPGRAGYDVSAANARESPLTA